MEEKYPIKFSLGQFILLLGVEVVVLALVFLLGARFGGTIYPGFHAEQVAANHAYQGLDPREPKAKAPAEPKSSGKLTDGEEPAEAPTVVEGQEGQAGTDEAGAEPSEGDEAPTRQEKLQENKSIIGNPNDKNTAVRFKSSGNSKFAVEVGKYFDEILASREIDKLKGKGIDAYLVIDSRGGSSPSFGVRVGSFGDRKLAEDFAAKMSNEQGMELRVVQVDL